MPRYLMIGALVETDPELYEQARRLIRRRSQPRGPLPGGRMPDLGDADTRDLPDAEGPPPRRPTAPRMWCGHPDEPDNLLTDPSGAQVCRACCEAP